MERIRTNCKQKVNVSTNEKKQQPIRLDFGSGYIRRPGFLRVDIDPNIDADIQCDIKNLNQFDKNFANEIICSHTIEHIDRKYLFQILRDFFKILKNHGTLTIITPDTYRVSYDWIHNKINDCCYEKIMLGSDPSATPYMLHKNLFWEKKLRRYLEITGFTNIQRKETNNKYELQLIAKKEI